MIWKVLPVPQFLFDHLCLFQETRLASCTGKYSLSWRSLDVKGALILPDFLAAGMLKRSWSPFQLSSAAHDLSLGLRDPEGKGPVWAGTPGLECWVEADLPLPVLAEKEEAGLQERWLKR